MRLKLITKYTLVTSGVLLLTMVAFAVINVKTLKDVFLREAIHDVDELSETIIRTTHYQMLEDDRKRVYQMIEEVGTQHGVEHIRLINKDGVINFSTENAEIGTLLDKNAEACSMCHAEDTPLTHASTMNRSRIFSDRAGKEVLGIAKGIYNQPACYTADCHVHPREAKILGVLDVIVSLEGMKLQTGAYRDNIIVLTFVLLLLIILSLVLATQQFVNQPVKKLLEHSEHLARGELDHRIELPARDELGELARSFNEMTGKLQATRQELKLWASTLETKVDERTQQIQQIQSKLVRSEKLASLGELVAGIAHEINNPLTGILMFASMIQNDERVDPSLQDDMEIIVRETQRCANIVRELLDFSRESVPQKKLESVTRIMEKTLALVRHQPAFHDIEILQNYGGPLPEVMVDPNQIEQVFMNILINASQAMPTGGTLSISTRLHPDGEFVTTRISDTGCGIPPEHLERIFDPFFTTKGHKGTGLGLSVSYGIVENHGGQIDIESEPGRGTTFSIQLPLAPPDADSSGQDNAATPPRQDPDAGHVQAS
ncbi:two-component sensor histidine kinase [Desulfuromonas versatilis]|uniref:histidine kinase n=1 Tax=Desulfuromonas versatilis TaxID=2802975 RepID=A0ABM8HXG4_9BACT|nr:HAMP domain-containing sensor histidine kinase [Desulfuromonas versatilis]BCR06654.1 two-component sensor histidine kinase [Desulfuromonas versatilis]